MAQHVAGLLERFGELAVEACDGNIAVIVGFNGHHEEAEPDQHDNDDLFGPGPRLADHIAHDDRTEADDHNRDQQRTADISLELDDMIQKFSEFLHIFPPTGGEMV